MRPLCDGTSQSALTLGWLTVFTWRASRANQRCQLNPAAESRSTAHSARRDRLAVYDRCRMENVLATARQIGKDGAEADSDVVHPDNFPKIAAISVNSGVIGGETARGCSGSEKIEVWHQTGRTLRAAG
jgi:hypothetical protein